jgi:hypothetical protein
MVVEGAHERRKYLGEAGIRERFRVETLERRS